MLIVLTNVFSLPCTFQIEVSSIHFYFLFAIARKICPTLDDIILFRQYDHPFCINLHQSNNKCLLYAIPQLCEACNVSLRLNFIQPRVKDRR